MKSLFRRVPIALLAVTGLVAITIGTLAFESTSHPALATGGTVEVWWPGEGASVSGIQPFKAVLSGKALDEYEMYWQTGTGVTSEMGDTYQDHPHKEDQVDVSKWPGDGEYEVTFIATTPQGETIAQKTVTIWVGQTETSQSTTPEISVWWPAREAELSGLQPFKVVLDGAELSDYQMRWQVDGRPLNRMVDSHEDHPHKEAWVDVSEWTWNGSGSYDVTFVAESLSGTTLATKTISVYVSSGGSESSTTTTSSSTTTSTTTTTSTSTTTTTTPTTSTTATKTASGLVRADLYVDPWSPAKQQADAIRDDQPYEASLLDKIADQPTAKWFGDWTGDIYAASDEATDTITAAGAVPVYVAYNIPLRDCSGYSAVGSQSADEYRSWIRSLADGIGDRTAAVILEPDALALIDCLPDDLRTERLDLLRFAVETLGAGGTTSVYIDAGHARWHSPEETARRLEAAGVGAARGFSLNVSNFVGTGETVNYGEQVAALLVGKPFVVDTSRNGLGPAPDGEWCNPPDRALGSPPSTSTGNAAVDAYLWVKIPGESDGTCNGGPPAGEFWTDYALGLAERADW